MANFWDSVTDFVTGGQRAQARRAADVSKDLSGRAQAEYQTFLTGLAAGGVSDVDIADIKAGKKSAPGIDTSAKYNISEYLSGITSRFNAATQSARDVIKGNIEATRAAPGRPRTMLNRSTQQNTFLTLLSETPNTTGTGQPVTLAKMRGY